MSVKNRWGEADAILVASVGCVVGRPFEESCRLSCWADTGGNGKIPGFRDHRHRQLSRGWPADGSRQSLAGLQACFLFLRPETGFEEDVGNRIVSSVATTGTWEDRGVITKAIQNLAAHGALCVLVEERDAKAILQGGTCEIGIPPSSRSGDLMQLEGDSISLCGSFHQRFQSVCVARVGQVALGVRTESVMPKPTFLIEACAWSQAP